MTLFQRSKHNQRVGSSGEHIAASFLQQHGYCILQRNFKARYGEIDIITEKDGVLVFVEVKTRIGTAFGTPEDAVTPGKLREIVKTSQYYAARNQIEDVPQRIDVIAVLMSSDGEVLSVRHLESVTS